MALRDPYGSPATFLHPGGRPPSSSNAFLNVPGIDLTQDPTEASLSAFLADTTAPATKRRANLLERLGKDRKFTVANPSPIPPTRISAFSIDNPFALELWKEAWHVGEAEHFMLDRRKLVTNEDQEDYLTLRKRQNRAWAEETTVQAARLVKGKEYDKAIKAFTHALDIDPEYVEAYIGRGCVYSNLRRYPEGVEDFKRALKLDPDNAKAKKFYDETRARTGHRDEDAAERAAKAARQAASAALSGASMIPSHHADLVLRRDPRRTQSTGYGLLDEDVVDEEGPARPPPESSKRRKRDRKDRKDKKKSKRRRREDSESDEGSDRSTTAKKSRGRDRDRYSDSNSDESDNDRKRRRERSREGERSIDRDRRRDRRRTDSEENARRKKRRERDRERSRERDASPPLVVDDPVPDASRQIRDKRLSES